MKVLYAPWKSAKDGLELIQGVNFPEGLKAEYFDNTRLEGIPKVRTEEWINFEPANQAPDPFLPHSPSGGRENCAPRCPVAIRSALLRTTAAA